jgi:hypothetical protein
MCGVVHTWKNLSLGAACFAVRAEIRRVERRITALGTEAEIWAEYEARK